MSTTNRLPGAMPLDRDQSGHPRNGTPIPNLILEDYNDFEVPLQDTSNTSDTTAQALHRLASENERLRAEMEDLRDYLGARGGGQRPSRRHRLPTPESPENPGGSYPVRKFKSHILGKLDPHAPEAFLSVLAAEQYFWSEPDLLEGVRKVLAGSKEPLVADWYRAELTTRIKEGTFRSMTLTDWIDAIRAQFGRTSREKRTMLRELRIRSSESMSEFVARARKVCTEAGVLSDAAQIDEIIDRLPEDYLPGLSPTNYTSVTSLLQELRIREKVLGKRRYDGNKRSNSSSPQRERKKSSVQTSFKGNATYSSKKSDRSKAPCPACTHRHWLKGANAEVCPECGCSDASPGPQKKSNKAKAYHATAHDSSDSSAESSQSESSSSDEDDSPRASSRGSLGSSSIGIHFVNKLDQEPISAYSVGVRTDKGVIHANTLGPLPSESAYQNITPFLISAGVGDEPVPSWYVLDTGSPLSFISDALAKSSGLQPVDKKDVLRLDGIVAGATIASAQGVIARLTLPMRNGKHVLVDTYLHVLPQLPVGLILGGDFSVPNRIVIDTEREIYSIGSAGRAVGDLKMFKRPGALKGVAIPLSAPLDCIIKARSPGLLEMGTPLVGRKVKISINGLALVRVSDTGITVENTTKKDIFIQAGETIGEAIAQIAPVLMANPFRL